MLLALPLPVLAADLQITTISDAGYDPSPAGTNLRYQVTVTNGASDNATGTVTIFDLPAGTSLGSPIASGCSVAGTAATGVTRVVCTNPVLNVNNTGTTPYSFNLWVSTQGHAAGDIAINAAIGYATDLPAVDTPVGGLTAGDPFFGSDTNKNNNKSAQTTTLQDASDLELSKTATPDPVIGGGEVTYTLTVKNNGPSAATGFTVTDTLPANVALVAGSPSGAGWTFTGANGTYNGSLANGASVSYSFRAKVNVGSGNITNGASVAAGTTPDPLPDNNSDTATTGVTAGADMSINKTASPSPASAGQNVVFTLTPRNNGPSAAAGVTIIDDLPEGFVVQGTPTATNWTCSVGVSPLDPDRQRVTCNRTGSMASGTQQDITVTALVPSTGPNSSGSVANTAQVSSTTPDPSNANNSYTANFTVLPDGADLQMSKTKTPALVPTYTGSGDRTDSLMSSAMTVRNLGPRAVSGQLQVVDTLALGEEWTDAFGNPIAPGVATTVGSGNNTWSCQVDVAWTGSVAQKVTCTLTSLYPVAVDTNRSLTLNTLARAAATTLTNTACTGGSGGSLEPLTAGGIDIDPSTGNDCTDGTSRATSQRADLGITKAAATPDSDKVLTTAENYVTYTLVISNTGADGTAGVVVDDQIPGFVNNVTTVSNITGLPAGWTTSGGSGTNGTLTIRSGANVLAAGASATISFRVNRGMTDSVGRSAGTCGGNAMPAGSWCNTAGVRVDASVTGSVGESNFANNSASDWVQVHPVADMATTNKTINSGNPGRAGVETTYLISYQNYGPSAVTEVYFRDTFTLPAGDAGFVLISAERTPGNTACAVRTPLAAGITATAAPGGTSYANTGGSDEQLAIVCPVLASMASGNTQSMTIKIRPNVNDTNTGRQFYNLADFYFDVDKDGTPDASNAGTLPTGESYNYDSNASNNNRDATLNFEAGTVDLIINKYDQGFTDGIDPLGYDSRPGHEADNRLYYQIGVLNSGPSLATGTTITDTLTPPRADVEVEFIGTRTGTATAMTGPLVPIGDAASPCAIAGGSSNPTVGAAQVLTCTMPGTGTVPVQPGVIANGQTSYLYLVYQYGNSPEANGDTLQNAVTVASNETETNGGNNTASETTTIRIRADLEMTKTAVVIEPQLDPTQALPAPAPVVSLYQPFWYVLDVLNKGPGHSLSRDRSDTNPTDGDGVVVTDTLPAGLEVLGGASAILWQKDGSTTDPGVVTNADGNCTLSGSAVSCHMGDLALDGRARILIPVRWTSWPGAAAVANTAVVKSEQYDPDEDNDEDTTTVAVKKSSLAGVVFEDHERGGANGGIKQSTESGISGVTVRLSGTDAYGNVLGGVTGYIETTTNANGEYLFDNLAPADADGYTLTQSQPATYVNGPVSPPTAGGDAPSVGGSFEAVSPVKTANSIYSGIVLPADTAGVRYNFPEVKRPSLSGYVYVDSNHNNTRDVGEDPISGAEIELLDADTGLLVDTATTDASGLYTFNDLDPLRTYILREVLPGSGEYINRPSAVTVGSNGGGTAEAEDATTDRISGIDLSAGLDGAGYNFGEDALAAISGTVYLDRDDNGDMNSGDVGIPGVTVVITSAGLDGVPGTADDIEVELTTGSDGRYSYPGAVAGLDYTITQTQPTGLLSGQEHNTNVIQVNNLPTTGSTGNDFGELAGSIAGRVWLDENNNGLIDAGENGIASVSISLPAGTLDALGNPVAAVTTDANGNYRFDDLLAGTYIVTEQAAQPLVTVGGSPVTTLNGTTVAGTINAAPVGAATPIATTPSAVSGIVLGAGQHSVQNDFGETLPVSVTGTVFLDIDNDGAQAGAGETGLSGVTIELTGTDDTGATVSLSTTTDGNGHFSFEGVRPGTYTLTEPTQPTGTANGITTAGTVGGTPSGTATPVTTVPSEIAGIDLTTPGSASVDNLFGEIPRSSGITGKVWLDRNNDGVVDPGETGIGGVRVELEGTAIDGTTISLWTTTEPDGSYSFIELPPGTYTVTEPTQPPGTLDGKTVQGSTGGVPSQTGDTPSKIETITVGVNEISTENNFGEIPAGSISGYVYNDSNDDGIKQGDEGGYAGVTVVLSGTDDLGNPVNATVTTNPDGSYEFPNLRPGTYVVTEPDQPLETLNGKTTAGSTGGTGSNPTPTSSEITGIVLAPGDESTDNNFGEIGDSPDMLVSKSSTTVKFTVNNTGSYLIRARNGGQKPSVGEYVVRDRLPAGLTLAGTPAGNGWTCTGAAGETRFECRSSEVVNAGATSPSEITVSVNVTEAAAKAGTVNNAVLVEGGGENEFRTPTPAERTAFDGDVTDLPVCDAGITQNACRVPNEVQLAASVGGTVWFDIGSDDILLDGGDERLQDWIVELVDPDTGTVVKTTTTAADGSYRFGDVIPGVKWNIQFRDPNSGVLWAWPVNKETAGGTDVSCDADTALANGGVSACRTSENGNSQLQVVLKPGGHLPQQSLPVDPSGVVYDAVTRDPVPGSIVTLQPVGMCNGYDPLTAILNAGAGGYTVEGNAISMTVGNNGYYQFVFGPAAPARCEFRLTVTPPGGYRFASSLIPPQEGALSPAGAAGTTHLVQPQATAPTGAVGADTQYWLTLFSGSATAGIVHNHIPLDTAEATGLVISKTGDRRIAEIGDTVQYTITVRQTAGSALATVNIVDTLPRGFTYIDGTARIGGRALADPLGRPGPRLGFDLGPIDVGGQLVLTYRVRVGVGAQQGDGVNRAQAHGCSIDGGCIDPVSLTPVPGSIPSNRAEYRVRVTGGVFTDEVCVLGKVFVDCNNNHVQDAEELGIPGVRLYFSNGTWVISDAEGKYSYCGLPPQSHTLKVDPSTLPVGARLTTSSNRNLGDADSLFLDLKNGELHRADFVEGSCSNPLLEQVKARRTQGEVRAPENEAGQSPLRFESKPLRAPQQATDSANQRPIVEPRPNPPSASAAQEVQP